MAASTSRPQLQASVASTESSPPPSPIPKQSGVELNHQKHKYLPPLSSHRPLADSTSDRPNLPTHTRHHLPGRQETPPSPPNSVLLEQSPTSQSQRPEGIAELPPANQLAKGANTEGQGSANHDSPPPSLKDRLTRAFKGHRRGESDASMYTNINYRDGRAPTSNHRHNNSDSTVGTSATVTAQNFNESNYILQTHSSRAGQGLSPSKPDFYVHQWASPIRPNSQNHYTYGHGGTKRRVMKGGEVRVEILPHPSLATETRGAQDELGRFSPVDERKEVLTYRANKQRGTEDVIGDDHGDNRDDGGDPRIGTPASLYYRAAPVAPQNFDGYLAPYNRSSGGTEGLPIHDGTVNSGSTPSTRSSDNSHERRFIEDATLSFGFDGFHIAAVNPDGDSDGFFAGLGSPELGSDSSHANLYTSSCVASSGALNCLSQTDINAVGGSSSLLGCVSSKSGSGPPSRLAMSSNVSGNSYYLAMQRGSSGNLPNSGTPPYEEAVSRELKRLSKISAGSGVSGVAIVVTADGAASTRLAESISDDEAGEVQRWTKEEKGKGRAVRSVTSGNGSMAEPGGSDTRPGNRKGRHGRSGSGISGWTEGDQSASGSGSEGGDDDSKGLLKEVDRGRKRKLKAQSVPKGVLVHEGDARYNFVYRMRQTSDETPILVPQYTFAPDSSFPNRNALTSPILAKASSPNLRGPDNRTPVTRFGGSPIAKPEGAILRSPDFQDSYYAIMQGDQAVDSYPNSSDRGMRSSSSRKSISQSVSDNRMTSLVHPALRGGPKTSAHPGRPRAALSMGSLEGIVGIGMRSLVTGTPGKMVGSSLADTSDPGYPLEDTPPKRKAPPKKVRMSLNLDEIAPAPERHSEDLRDSERHIQRKKSLRVQVPSRKSMRPVDLRRSMTPRLYTPRPLGDSWKDLADLESLPDHEQTREYRRREAKAGRILLGFCLLFPPLLLVVAWGGFDVTVEGWTSGQVKGVGDVEKKIAAWVGGASAICVVVGIIVGSVLVSV